MYLYIQNCFMIHLLCLLFFYLPPTFAFLFGCFYYDLLCFITENSLISLPLVDGTLWDRYQSL